MKDLKIFYKNEKLSDNVIILKTVIENNGKKEMVLGVNICGCNEEMSFDDLIVKKTVRGPYVIFR